MTTPLSDTDTLLRDSLALENCKTEREFSYTVRNIEARHAVEGITALDASAWEHVKAQHARRIARVMAA